MFLEYMTMCMWAYIITISFTEPLTAVAFTSVSRTKASTAIIEWGELSWKELRGVLVSYEIGYNSVGSGDKCSVANSDNNHTTSVHQERGVLTDLDPGLQYCVRVAAKTSAGIGPFNQALIPCRNLCYVQFKLM